jgi:predicted transcriptional regulator YdeE
MTGLKLLNLRDRSNKTALTQTIMDSFILGEDIEVMCIKADKFPDGIQAAHQKLHRTIPLREDRRFFGISRPEPDENGTIVYKAAAEYFDSDELSGLEKFTIKGGSYNTYYIKDYRNNIDAIAECFDLLTGQAETDPNGYCIEWYIGDNDVKCMVRCNDKDYPVDNK